MHGHVRSQLCTDRILQREILDMHKDVVIAWEKGRSKMGYSCPHYVISSGHIVYHLH